MQTLLLRAPVIMCAANLLSRTRQTAAITCCITALFLSGILLAQSASPTPEPTAEPTTEPSTGPTDEGEVSRAQFSSLVTDREPVDSLTSTTTDVEKLYFFTEVNNMAGKVIIHRWRYFDEVVVEIPFTINGPRWRVNSYKNLEASMSGEWSVELVDDKGNNYGEHAILVAESTGKTPAATEQPVAADSSVTDTPKVQPATGIDRIKMLFPDTDYVLINDPPVSEICPPSGSFKWQQSANQLWTLNMGTRPHIRVHATGKDVAALRPDPDFATSGSNCVMYSGHNFSEVNAELVTELQSDCEGENNDVFSARSLRRHADFVDLTIYAEQLAVCRYRIN